MAGPSNDLTISSRPRLADLMVDVDFNSIPKIYGTRFKERAEAMDKLNKEVEKGLYDWKPSWTNAEDKEKQVNVELEGVSEPDIVCVNSSPSPPKRARTRNRAVVKKESKETKGSVDTSNPDIVVLDSSPPSRARARQPSRETKRLLRQIERMKAVALATVGPNPEVLQCDDAVDDEEVCAKIEAELQYNRTMNVRVVDYKDNLKKYNMLVRDSFVKIFDDLAQEHSIERSQVMLTYKDKFIKIYDTPKSIEFGVGELIKFCKLSEPADGQPTQIDKSQMITLKLQSATTRRRIKITIYKVDPLLMMMKEYCKLSGQDLTKLSFVFDDEKISSDSTANELDIENGDIIDVIEAK